MRKSPLSTPGGSRGRQGFGWKSHNRKNRTGYSPNNGDVYPCISPNAANQMKYGGDYLSLNVSTPVTEQKKYSGNWYGSGNSRNHRNSSSGEYNYYRNNYANQKPNYDNSYSPYKHSGKQFHAYRKAYQKDAHRHVDISEYIDMKSFLEDPWADLVQKLNESKEAKSAKSPKAESLSDYQTRSTSELDDSLLSQESKNDSLDTSFGLTDTDASALSKTESSIDLTFDNVCVSQDSKNNSPQCAIKSPKQEVHQEDNGCDSCNTETSIPQESI